MPELRLRTGPRGVRAANSVFAEPAADGGQGLFPGLQRGGGAVQQGLERLPPVRGEGEPGGIGRHLGGEARRIPGSPGACQDAGDIGGVVGQGPGQGAAADIQTAAEGAQPADIGGVVQTQAGAEAFPQGGVQGLQLRVVPAPQGGEALGQLPELGTAPAGLPFPPAVSAQGAFAQAGGGGQLRVGPARRSISRSSIS